MNLVVEQKRLGPRSFFVCVLFIDLLHILALDMYTPALPSMQQELNTSAAYLNSTVFTFLLLSAITMLFAGTVSDRLGRKPPILFGTTLFTLASIGCILAPGIVELVLFRSGQAIGYGISATVAPAMLRDAYDDKSAKVSLSLMQSLVIVGPVLAPFLGSAMLTLMDWRGIFVFLAISGAVTICLALLVTETLPASSRSHEPFAESVRDMIIGARTLLAKPGFSSLNVFLALGGVPYFAFIAASSYIVLTEFGLGYLEYSITYATVCIVNMLAPYVYLVMSKCMDMTSVARISTGLVCLAAVLLVFVAPVGVVLLVVSFLPYALAEGIIRPACYVELLDQRQTLVGTASAVSNFTYHTVTALATVVATLGWPSMTFGLGMITAATAVVMVAMTAVCGSGWNLRDRRAREGAHG